MIISNYISSSLLTSTSIIRISTRIKASRANSSRATAASVSTNFNLNFTSPPHHNSYSTKHNPHKHSFTANPVPRQTTINTHIHSVSYISSFIRTYAKGHGGRKMPPKKEIKVEKILLGRPGNNLKSGIVGLANVGKSTLFQAITKCSLGNPAVSPSHHPQAHFLYWHVCVQAQISFREQINAQRRLKIRVHLLILSSELPIRNH